MVRVLNLNVIKNFLIILLPLAIVLGNFMYLVFNFNFYNFLYEKSGVYQTLDKDLVKYVTNNLFDYFRGKNQLDHNFFSTQAVSHLKDVRDLLVFANGLFYLSLIAVLITAVSLTARRQLKIVLESLFISSIATIIFVAALGLGMATVFDSFFLKFHQILFANTLWLFPADDTLIKLFPEQFFVEFANRLALNVLAASSAIAVVSLLLKKLTRP